MRPHSAFENREYQFAFVRREALLLLSVEGIRAASRIREIVAVAMTMSVAGPAGLPHFALCAKRDPAAETDKSHTRRGVGHLAEPCGEGDSRDPHHCGDQQGRHDVADARLE